MVPARYTEAMREVKDKFWWRQKMVKYAKEHGISGASREFGTTRKTVRLWFYRYLKDGVKGLLDHSRAPHQIPHKTSKEMEQKVIELKRRYFTFSASRLKELFDLSLSCGAMYRIWREHGLLRKKKKYKRQRDLREVKRGYRVLEKLQIDTKRLDDIVDLYPAYHRYRLPRYEFTARDVRTGGSWIAYAREGSLTNAVIFLKLLGGHLKGCGIDLKRITIQTDNGGEFIGNLKKKEVSEFVRLVEKDWGGHFPIPPGAKTYNSDVEAFHRRVEEEFYRIEPISSYLQFFGKAKTYMRWFNYKRYNSYKDGSPLKLLKESNENSYPPQIFDFTPILLDNYIKKTTGYNLPVEYKIFLKNP
jgi:transposase